MTYIIPSFREPHLPSSSSPFSLIYAGITVSARAHTKLARYGFTRKLGYICVLCSMCVLVLICSLAYIVTSIVTSMSLYVPVFPCAVYLCNNTPVQPHLQPREEELLRPALRLRQRCAGTLCEDLRLSRVHVDPCVCLF